MSAWPALVCTSSTLVYDFRTNMYLPWTVGPIFSENSFHVANQRAPTRGVVMSCRYRSHPLSLLPVPHFCLCWPWPRHRPPAAAPAAAQLRDQCLALRHCDAPQLSLPWAAAGTPVGALCCADGQPAYRHGQPARARPVLLLQLPHPCEGPGLTVGAAEPRYGLRRQRAVSCATTTAPRGSARVPRCGVLRQAARP